VAKNEFMVHVVGILFFRCLSSEVERLVEWCGVVFVNFFACEREVLMQHVLCAVCGKEEKSVVGFT